MNTTRACTQCGAVIAGGIRFCETCGQPVAMIATVDPPTATRGAVVALASLPAAPLTTSPPATSPTAMMALAPANAAAVGLGGTMRSLPAKPTTGGAWGLLALILGAICLFALAEWPIWVSPLGIGGLVCGFFGRKSTQRPLAIFGAIFSLLGLIVFWWLLLGA